MIRIVIAVVARSFDVRADVRETNERSMSIRDAFVSLSVSSSLPNANAVAGAVPRGEGVQAHVRPPDAVSAVFTMFWIVSFSFGFRHIAIGSWLSPTLVPHRAPGLIVALGSLLHALGIIYRSSNCIPHVSSASACDRVVLRCRVAECLGLCAGGGRCRSRWTWTFVFGFSGFRCFVRRCVVVVVSLLSRWFRAVICVRGASEIAGWKAVATRLSLKSDI